MDRIFVSLRYLFSRPITLISTLGVMLSVGALVVVDSVMNGFLREQKRVIRGTHADLAFDIPREIRKDAAAIQGLLAATRTTEGVWAATLRLQCTALIQSTRQSEDLMWSQRWGGYHCIELIGVDAEAEAEVTDFRQFLELPDELRSLGFLRGSAGRNPLQVERTDDPFWWNPERLAEQKYARLPIIPILVSISTAEHLFRFKIGDVIHVSSWTEHADEQGKYYSKSRPFVVCGAFQSEDEELNLTRAFVPRDKLQDFMGNTSIAREIVARASPGVPESVVRDRLRQTLQPLGIPQDSVETWEDRKAVLLRAVENERRILNIVLFCMELVAAFNLLVTLNMMVSEKVRDIGTLRSMGVTKLGICGLFLVCGMCVTLVGLVLGLSGGLLLTFNINPVDHLMGRVAGFSLFNPKYYSFTSIPTEVDPLRLTVFAIATVVCTTFFTLFPSFRAARLDPVEALRRG